MTTIVDLNAAQTKFILDTNQQQKQAIISAARADAVSKNGFVFFAAFDGTNNEFSNDGSLQNTNVAQLFTQVAEVQGANPNVFAYYYAGPGTQGSLKGSSWESAQVTAQVIATARSAYRDFVDRASGWLATNAGKSVTAAFTSFSRGCASSAIFSQLLYEKGLVDPNDAARVLIAPGKITVSAGLLFDPVTTGVRGNLAFTPNVKNVLKVLARNEIRQFFRAANYSNQPDIVTTIPMYGNHCDIGGSYDNGIAAISLEAATGFFRRSGLPIADVPASRRFTGRAIHADQALVIHSEGDKWDEYGNFSLNTITRLFDNVVTPATPTTVNGAAASRFVLYDGTTITIA